MLTPPVRFDKPNAHRLAAPMALHLDGRDIQILQILSIDGRISKAKLAERVNRELLAAGRLIARPAHSDLGRVLRITAVEDALVPGQLKILEDALR